MAVPIAVVIKDVPLRTELVTEFGLKGDGKKRDEARAGKWA
jgi:hypothetical protein